jgi:hypothetical protein
MNWFEITLIVLFALNTVVSILMIGKPRPSLTPRQVAFGAIFNALLILGVIRIGA